MKTTVLLHDAKNSMSKNINQEILSCIENDCDIILDPVHSNLFNIYQQIKPRYILLNASEYTQEFQDFLMDHANDTNIFLFIDTYIDNQQLIDFWNTRPIQIFVNKSYKNQYNKYVSDYDKLYNHNIFYDKQLKRNNKIAVILSQNNVQNEKIENILYPNSINHKVVVFNNPNFKSLVNLGILNEMDLSDIFNTFESVIDLDKSLYLEAQACGIKYYDITNTEPKEAIIDNKFQALDLNLKDFTYSKFVKEKIIPNIRI